MCDAHRPWLLRGLSSIGRSIDAQAVESYFSANPQATAAAVSPANARWLEDFLGERIKPLGEEKLGPNTLARFSKATTSQGEWFRCADGTLHLTDEYEVDANLLSAADEVFQSGQ